MQHLNAGSVAILGVPVNNVNMDQALSAIESCIAEGGFHQIATANVDFLVNAVHDSEMKDILSDCFMVLADGMPLVWASRIMGAPLQERVCGADLVPRLVELSALRGYRIFLVGSSDASSHGATKWIARHYPEAKVVGRYCPAFAGLDEMDHEDILLQIEAANPDILLVALGSPKQEKWLAMHRHRLRVPVCIGVGCCLDLLAGHTHRAPLWMQNHGLEWLYRVRQEPGRLILRYARDASGLARYLTAQIAATATQHQRPAPNSISEETLGPATVMHLEGNLTGGPVNAFEQEARLAVETGHHLVLDLAGVGYLGPDALGALIHLGSTARRSRRELWLTGVRPVHHWLMRATRVGSCFRTAPTVAAAIRRMASAETELCIEAGKDWAVCRIGGRLIPLSREEAAAVCRKIFEVIEERALGVTLHSQDAALESHVA